MKKLLLLAIALSLCAVAPEAMAQRIGFAPTGPNAINRCSNLTALQCAAIYGYTTPQEHGGLCNGGSDDSMAILAAADSGKPVLVEYPCGWYSPIVANQDNLFFFQIPNSPFYSNAHIPANAVHVFTNNIAVASPTKQAFDANGYHNIRFSNFSAFGDDLQNGVVFFASSVNYSDPNNPALFYFDYGTYTGFGNVIGSALDSTGAPIGTLGNNQLEVHVNEVHFTNNARGMYLNGSDTKVTNSVFSGNSVQDYGMPNTFAGISTGSLIHNRFESCCAGYGTTVASHASVEISASGQFQLADNEFRSVSQCAVLLDGYWNNVNISGGSMYQSGTANVANYNAHVCFNGAQSAYNKNFSWSNVQLAASGGFPANGFNFLGTTDNNLKLTGGNGDATAYGSGGLYNYINETPSIFEHDLGGESFAQWAKPVYAPTVGINSGYNFQLHNGFMCAITGFTFSICFDSPASTINRWIFHGSATGNNLSVTPETGGSDANTGFNFIPSGNAHLQENGVNTLLATNGVFASKPASPAIGQHYFATDLGTSGTEIVYTGSLWKPVNGVVVWQGGLAKNSSGASATQLISQLIPPNLMTSASMLRITTLWTYPNSANNKTLSLFLAATTGTPGAGTAYLSQVVTTTATNSIQTMIRNVNATNSQVGFSNSGNSYSTSGGSKATSTVDFTANAYVNIEITMASSGDTGTLLGWTIEAVIP